MRLLTDERMNEWTDRRTNGQIENIMYPAHGRRQELMEGVFLLSFPPPLPFHPPLLPFPLPPLYPFPSLPLLPSPSLIHFLPFPSSPFPLEVAPLKPVIRETGEAL